MRCLPLTYGAAAGISVPPFNRGWQACCGALYGRMRAEHA